MKSILTILLGIISISSFAQNPLTPGNDSFEKKWIKNSTYDMTWYALRDTLKFEIGKVSTQLLTDKNTLHLITQVSLKGRTTPWVDSTSADTKTLKPIRHSSYNAQRDMVLNFGKVVSGFYNDKAKNQNTVIHDTTKVDYFDSNLYPTLITWLPLKEGYKKDISIYDYNPSAKIGVLKASVTEVKNGTYKSINSGNKEVWIVTVADEISNGISTYYIDKADRKLWKQEISVDGRNMMMLRTE
ncbi:MAG: hypothetical protein ABI663_00900 [Chryseolinea sp.]